MMSLVVAEEYVRNSAKLELVGYEVLGTKELNGETLYVIRERKS